MSIVIHFNPSPFIPSAAAVPSTPQCLSQRTANLEMVPGIEHSDDLVMTDDESSAVDIATSNTLYSHSIKELKSSGNHGFGSCFGLPYQDHNYGAPPPPTPPSYSPYASPTHVNGIPDEDTNLSVVSTSTTNEETQEGSITRCICGFEHDDEYMICCDLCLVWQHVDCMGLDRTNIPDTYLCEKCEPRKVDRHKAKVLQTRKKVAMTVKHSTTAINKQEPCINGQFFGKDSKKKALLQTYEEWPPVHKSYQAVSSVPIVQRFYYSSDSDQESASKNTDRRPKTRSRKRKKDDENSEEKTEQVSVKKSRTIMKHAKDRMEMKRSRLRRTKNKESTSTADEEAQDAWEYSPEWCEKNFEPAGNNQYTPEVQHIARSLSSQGHEKAYLDQLLIRQCKILLDGNKKKLICLYDLPRDQPVIEYKGKFLLASQFHDLHPLFNKRLYPYVIFYTLQEEEICVDASVYGNDARFVRRSCRPNAEIRYMAYNGNLHLYISSTKVIFRDDEVTIPHDFTEKDSDIECACDKDCLLKPKKRNGSIEENQEKKKKYRRTASSPDDDSSHSLATAGILTSKFKTSPVKNSSFHQVFTPVVQLGDNCEAKLPSDHEAEEQANERKRKMTREERKIDAIMRAFDQMEKAERRRQQALERQRAQQPKSEDFPEKSENTVAVPNEEKVTLPTPASGSEAQSVEEEKATTPTAKLKKGKRRRGSGTPSRRRIRTNSGGSDILSPDETLLSKISLQPDIPPVPGSDISIQNVCLSPCPLPPSGLSSPVSSVPPASPVVLKTKRFLLHEWLQEKSEVTTAPATSPLSIHTERRWNRIPAVPTCYVRCTKDTPNSGGISAAHLRRSNSSGHIKPVPLKAVSEHGSAKKRWLRQAMYDTSEEQLSIDPTCMDTISSPTDNGYLSPNCQEDIGSPEAATDDIVTPLKKRRLMRESVESVPSPHSPATNSMDCTVTSVSDSVSSDIKAEPRMEMPDKLLYDVKTDSLSPVKNEDSMCKINGLRMDIVKYEEETNNEEMEIYDDESVPSISSANEFLHSNNSLDGKLNSDEYFASKGTGPAMQANCDLESETQSDIKLESDRVENCLDSSQSSCTKISHEMANTCRTFKSDPQVTTSLEKIVSSTSELIHLNQSTCNIDESENVFAQKRLLELCVTDVLSSVNKSEDDISDKAAHVSPNSCSKETLSISAIVKEQSSFMCDILTKNETTKPLSGICSLVQEQTEDRAVNQILDNSEMPKSILSVSSVTIHPSPSLHAAEKQSTVLNGNSSTPCTSPDHVVCNSMSSLNLSGSILDSNKSNDSNSETITKTKEAASLPNENVANVMKAACVSATQKRKVSLSEYRMRMRESTNKNQSNSDTLKKSTSAPAICATAIPEPLPELVTLAPLPLFDTGSSSPVHLSAKSSKKKKIVKSADEEINSDVIEHRENLTDRLKREFGFEDDSDVNNLIPASVPQAKPICTQVASGANTSILPLCAQPPPPPPPPPPRPPRPAQSTFGGASASPSQFGFPIASPFPQQSYVVSQVTGAQYIATQTPLSAPTLQPVHQINPSGVQGSVRPPLLPSPSTHSFRSPLPSGGLRPPVQHEYASANAQNFAALVQQPPPPPPPHKTYPHVYQSGLFK